MLRYLLICTVLSCAYACSDTKADDRDGNVTVPGDTVPLTKEDTASDVNSLTDRVRDGKITKEDALALLKKYIPLIDAYYYSQGGKKFTEQDHVFPLKGYTSASIGGKNGDGYIADGYSYFDGNKHLGHPAQDIFIHDGDQDCLDDRTKEPVSVLSFSGGIVVAIETEWDTKSEQRGGKYIWIYDPSSHSMFYYAHNNTILVKQGTLVKPGDVISTVGRTGLNAYKKRSPTHLHFMELVLDEDDIPQPVNPYPSLLKAKVK